LGTIKNVGEGPTEAVVEERKNGPYRDIFDFCSRLDTRFVNRRLVESLNKAGAFASTGWNRRQVAEVIESALSEGQVAQRERSSGQTSLFDMGGMEAAAESIHLKPDLMEWPEHELLQYEKEMLGLYVSGHPLLRFAETLERYATFRPTDLPDLRDEQEGIIGGLVGAIRTYHGNRGKMGFVTVETLEGSCEVTVFSELYEQKAGILLPDSIVLIQAKVNYRNGEPGFVANGVFPIEEAEAHLTRAVHIRIAPAAEPGLIDRLSMLLGKLRGACDVYFHCDVPERGEVIVHATSACRVAANPGLRRAVEETLGPGSVWFSGGMGLPSHAAPRSAAAEPPRWKKKRNGVNN
jgi:DNA polymerase-3 subunit alpha